jgi:hypothetical protein
MSDMTHGVSHDARGPLVFGLVLVVIGIAGLVGMAFPQAGGLVVLAIGLGMLVLFLATRAYGWLIPGGIVTGLGAGIAVAEYGNVSEDGGVIVAGLGLGFLSIWILGSLFRLRENHPWPLVPGAILVTIGASLWLQNATSIDVELWPLLLIVLGLVVIGSAFFGRRAT